MKILRIILGIIATTLLPLSISMADILRYSDEAGKEHFVGSLDKVPEQYRNQLEKAKPLPEISKITGSPKVHVPHTQVSSPPVYSSHKVEIFVTSWCPYCKQLEKYLIDHRIKFTKYDIETNSTGEKIHAQLGGGGVPVIRIGTKVLHGYDPDELSRALKN